MPKSKNNVEESAKPKLTPKKAQSPKANKNSPPNSHKKNSDLVSYKIRLLDSEQLPLDISISKNDEGQALFNKVCDELGGIIERDYFGLRYMDKNNQRQWLDLGRSVRKQLVGAHSTALSFRVKHYPGNPITDFHQEISQYLLYLQIRRDLVQGRLLCPLNELYTIGALILQSEYGDAPGDSESNELGGNASSEEDYRSYFKNFKVVFNQTKKIESEIINRHKTYRGLTARDAEVEVIKRASKLPTYGVDPFPVKILKREKITKVGDSVSMKSAATGDANANSTLEGTHQDGQSHKTAPVNSSGSVYLGLRHTGLTTYVGLQPSENLDCQSGSQIFIGPKHTQTYSWDSIERLACDGKDFIVYLKPDIQSGPDVQKSSLSKKNKSENQKKKAATTKLNKKLAKPRVVTFRCDTKAAALALWKWTVDRQSFFTLRQASEAKITKTTNSIFRRSHSYRFIGKSQMELKSLTNSAESLPQPSFVRVSSLRRPRGHEGDFDPLAARATLPARVRTVEASAFPMGDPAKRPPILQSTGEEVEDLANSKQMDLSEESRNPPPPSIVSAATEQTSAPAANHGIMNIADDLAAAPGSEANTPIKGSEVSDSVTVVPVSANIVATSLPCSADDDESTAHLRHRANHTNKPAARDSECLRAVKEIDNVIDSVQNANGCQNPLAASTLPNGEVASHESKSPTAVIAAGATAACSESCSNSTLIYALEAAAVLGIVCFGVVIAALETRPLASELGRQSDFWTDLAMQLRGQPLVSSFNEYIYAPLRSFFIGGGH